MEVRTDPIWDSGISEHARNLKWVGLRPRIAIPPISGFFESGFDLGLGFWDPGFKSGESEIDKLDLTVFERKKVCGRCVGMPQLQRTWMDNEGRF